MYPDAPSPTPKAPAALIRLYALLTPVQKRQLLALSLAMLATAVLQLAGVTSILPFVNLLTHPEVVTEDTLYARAYDYLGFDGFQSFALAFGVVVLALLVLGNAFIVLTQWLITRRTWQLQSDLSSRLLATYLAQPYTAHIQRNSSEYSRNILQETAQLAQGVVRPVLSLFAAILTAAALSGLLIWINPGLSAAVAVVLAAAYGLIYFGLRPRMQRLGTERLDANAERFSAVNEAFGSVREVKVLHKESHFLDRYTRAARHFARSMADYQLLQQIPRYGIEALAFGTVVLVALYLLRAPGGVSGALPVISVFAVAAYRLLPAFQQIFQGISTLRFNRAAVAAVCRDFDQARADGPDALPAGPVEPLPYEQTIRLREVCFRYPGARSHALDKVSLEIPRNSFVALAGATGAGKTTLADLILGILPPESGEIAIDDVVLNDENRRAWQANLGYVPQDVYLADDTIAANIAFGEARGERDPASIRTAAERAHVHEFIEQELPHGYNTRVGERGVRLSGGQRQRIGIARALYRDPAVLILDEATNALDNATESAVHNAIMAARQDRTIIVIAHRLHTITDCDRIFLLDQGRLEAVGSYRQLEHHSPEFRRLANRDRLASEA